jgi:TRAP-type uncharacterized transport system substrate-binding protein
MRTAAANGRITSDVSGRAERIFASRAETRSTCSAIFRNLITLVLIAGALALAGTRDTVPEKKVEKYGISTKRPVLAAACKICPWGALADIVAQAMKPYGDDVQVCYNCSRLQAPRLVASDGKPEPVQEEWKRAFPAIPRDQVVIQIPPPPDAHVDFGVTGAQFLYEAYHGIAPFKHPRKNLRLLANIQSPDFLIVAVQSSLGITNLGQLRKKKWPVRLLLGIDNGPADAVLRYYGLSEKEIESAGGHIGNGSIPAERENFDVIIAGGNLGNAPEYNVWYQVSQRDNLTYLQLPDTLLNQLAKDFNMERGTIPDGLLRGIDHSIPTVVRTGTAIFARADTPNSFAYSVAQAMDVHQDLLQWSSLRFSYNVHAVWKAYDVPLHPGAAHYYRQVGHADTGSER